MRQASCSQCAVGGPLRNYFLYNNQIYCADCAEYLRIETVPGALPAALIDPTICSRCQADNGNSEFPIFGSLPLCPTCQSYVQANPYPVWLRAGLLALLALLVVALVHGRRYFSAGRQLYIGEKLIEEGRYAEAVPHLKQTVQVAPGSDKAVLLLAKAALLSGDPKTAADAVYGHNNGRDFEQDRDFHEVDALFARIKSALDKMNKAAELARQSGKAAEADALMHQAAAEYPEMKALSGILPYFDAGAAFERKDYDQFVAFSELLMKEQPNSPETAGEAASAYACKFAVTGDPAWKQKAEDMLERAHQLSKKSPDDMKSYEEYAERTRYRLTSRVIIDKPEYDKRFRSAPPQGAN